MNEEKSSIPDSLRHKFPDLRPVKRTPVMITVNGIGFSLFGKRAYDEETRTYVKTHCLCFIFVPLIALGAYRVADAEQGWYFIGKERLSSFAKSWNAGFLLLSLMFAAIVFEHAHKSSPDYQAGQDLKHASEAMKAGRTVEAAKLYRGVAEGSARIQEGKKGLSDSLEQCLNSEAPEKAEAGLRLLASLPQRLNSPEPIVPNARTRGMALVEKFRSKNPEAALQLLPPAISLAGGTNANFRPLEIELLTETIAANPNNTNRVVELALIYEEQKQMPECFKLLTPYQNKLGATEGARILGEHLLEESKYDAAYALLYPYVQTNLIKLHALERDYTNAMNGAYHRAIESLNHNGADASFYSAYKSGSKAQQADLVDAYASKFMRTDGPLLRAEGELRSANKIVNVTLDLGIVQLSRAQQFSEPASRKAELEAAEKTLLSIRGLAGGSDTYRLHLGQVYYWLGRASEGKKLLDDLLEAHKRDFSVLMAVAETVRAVGDDSQARTLLEEAYQTAKKDEDRFRAANVRARTFQDYDDEIAWLKKADPKAPYVQIDLNSAQGARALQEENREQAADFLRKAATGYEGLPRNATTLNNCGLVYLDLFNATGNIEDYNKGLGMFEQAVAIAPSDSVLLNNITHLFLTRAYMDAVGKDINFAALKESPDSAMLMNLYLDEAGRKEVYDRLRHSDYMRKALSYLDKTLLLMPKNSGPYQFSLHIQASFRDLTELEKLQHRLELATPDLTEVSRQMKEQYLPEKEKKRLERLQKDIRRYESLLAVPPIKADPLTLATAENKLNELSIHAETYGGQVEAKKYLEQALTTYQRRPSAASRSALLSARFLFAHEELRQQSADYARQAERTRRSLRPRDLLVYMADHNSSVAELVRANANLLQAAELLKEEFRLVPSHRSVGQWAIFHILEPKLAEEILAQLKQDKAGRLIDQLQFRLNPLSATFVMEQYWTSRMNNDETSAAQIYQRAATNGVPLPAL